MQPLWYGSPPSRRIAIGGSFGGWPGYRQGRENLRSTSPAPRLTIPQEIGHNTVAPVDDPRLNSSIAFSNLSRSSGVTLRLRSSRKLFSGCCCEKFYRQHDEMPEHIGPCNVSLPLLPAITRGGVIDYRMFRLPLPTDGIRCRSDWLVNWSKRVSDEDAGGDDFARLIRCWG